MSIQFYNFTLYIYTVILFDSLQ